MTRAVDIVRKVAPKAKAEYLQAFEAGDGLLRAAGITTPLRLAHFLAQVLHETGGLTIEWENMNYSAARMQVIFGVGHHSAAVTASEAEALAGRPAAIAERVYGLGNPKKAKELGNLQPGDGYKYRGGGIMQTTGRANYRRMGQKTGVNFEANPLLVVSAEHALKPALAEWTEGNLNAKADANDLLGITKRINGGTNGLADRQAWLQRVRQLIDEVTFATGAIAPPPLPKPPVTKSDKAVVGGAVVAAGASTAQYGWWIGLGVVAVLGLCAFLYFKFVRK